MPHGAPESNLLGRMTGGDEVRPAKTSGKERERGGGAARGLRQSGSNYRCCLPALAGFARPESAAPDGPSSMGRDFWKLNCRGDFFKSHPACMQPTRSDDGGRVLLIGFGSVSLHALFCTPLRVVHWGGTKWTEFRSGGLRAEERGFYPWGRAPLGRFPKRSPFGPPHLCSQSFVRPQYVLTPLYLRFQNPSL